MTETNGHFEIPKSTLRNQHKLKKKTKTKTNNKILLSFTQPIKKNKKKISRVEISEKRNKNRTHFFVIIFYFVCAINRM